MRSREASRARVAAWLAEQYEPATAREAAWAVRQNINQVRALLAELADDGRVLCLRASGRGMPPALWVAA